MPDAMRSTLHIFGTFSTPSYGGVGEPYNDRKAASSRDRGRQFLTNKPRIGQTGDNWNRGTGRKVDWKVLYEGEKYADPHRARQEWNKAQRAKNLTTDGIRYPNPNKKNSGLGGYWGCIGPKFVHEPEFEVLTKEDKPAPVFHEQRNCVTNPSKKGLGLVPGSTFGPPPKDGVRPKEYAHMMDEYDRANQLEQANKGKHTAAMGGRAPFRSMSKSLDFFDSQSRVAASKVYTEDPMIPAKEEPEAAEKAPLAPFYPAKAPSSGRQATFHKFPQHMEDPEEEKFKAERAAVEAAKPIGPPFKPTSRPKTVRQRTIMFHQAGKLP